MLKSIHYPTAFYYLFYSLIHFPSRKKKSERQIQKRPGYATCPKHISKEETLLTLWGPWGDIIIIACPRLPKTWSYNKCTTTVLQ